MRYLGSLLEQGMGAIITFGINLWLIRNGEAASYGVYVFWYAVAWVLATCQSTLTLVHLSSLPSGADRLAERREPERVLFSVSLLIMAACALGVFVANQVLHGTGSNLDEPAAALFIPAFLLYQFVRAFAFSRRRVVLAAGLTGAVMTVAALGLAGDAWLGFRPDAARVLVIVGIAYGVCAGTVLLLLDPSIRPMVRRSGLHRYAQYLRGSGWMMLGAGSAEITNRLYSFIVVAWFGTAALAALSAVQVVIRPAWMLSAAWSSIGFPAMATQRAAGDLRGMFTTMLRGAAMTAAGSALWTGAVIAAWPWISHLLYRGRYADLGMLGWFWGGNVVLGSIAVAPNIAMLVLGQFRRLALIDLFGAAVCSLSLVLLLTRFDYPAAILGTMAGQAAQILLMAAVLARRFRAELPRAVAAPPGPALAHGSGGSGSR
jgi:O-antigen/teichoic acid export membrane protein